MQQLGGRVQSSGRLLFFPQSYLCASSNNVEWVLSQPQVSETLDVTQECSYSHPCYLRAKE
jgi:hypothetical protein